MNRNIGLKNFDIEELLHAVMQVKSKTELTCFFRELLTESELSTLAKRWQILKKLIQGETQRQISKDLKVSLCKVTRGSKIIQDEKSVLTKYLIKEINYES